MSLCNCKDCGQLYLRSKSEYCPECQAIHDEYYFTVRNFLISNPKSTVLDIHEKTGIPIAKLLELKKQDYIPFGK